MITPARAAFELQDYWQHSEEQQEWFLLGVLQSYYLLQPGPERVRIHRCVARGYPGQKMMQLRGAFEYYVKRVSVKPPNHGVALAFYEFIVDLCGSATAPQGGVMSDLAKDERMFRYAIETALEALKAADGLLTCERDTETGWRSDEYCDAYQVLHGYHKARWGSALSQTPLE